MFVQKDALNELLLGTDVQSLLGFTLSVAGQDEQETNLLSQEELPQRVSALNQREELP